MRRLHSTNQHRARTGPRNGTEQSSFCFGVFAALHNHLALGLTAQLLQCLQLLIKQLGAAPQSASAELRKILVAMFFAV